MKVALITGGAKRIGAAICRHLHEHDWHVIVHYNYSNSTAEALVNELNAKRPGTAASLQAELSAEAGLAEFASQCLSVFGRLDLLVNNASQFYPTQLANMTSTAFDELMSTNARAPLLLTQALAAELSGGSIVNIIDIHGSTPLKDYPAYSASKAALNMLTRSLALELAPDVRVNGVAPGAILWPEDSAEMSGSEKQALLEKIPMQRLGNPIDIARTVRFLSEDAAFITGQIINVDGGQTI